VELPGLCFTGTVVNVYRHGWVKLATGSQTEAHDEKSLAGHDGQRNDDAEYDEVAVCHCYTAVFTVHLHCFLLSFFHRHYNSNTTSSCLSFPLLLMHLQELHFASCPIGLTSV